MPCVTEICTKNTFLSEHTHKKHRTVFTDLWVCASFSGTTRFDFHSSFKDTGSSSILLSTCTVSYVYRSWFLGKASNLDQDHQWCRNSTSSACRDCGLASL